jgi:hypothetical protein
MLKTETQTDEIEERIAEAFGVTDQGIACADFSLWFEHGQWWVESLEGEHGEEVVVYSVVDATGGKSVDGFDFERV